MEEDGLYLQDLSMFIYNKKESQVLLSIITVNWIACAEFKLRKDRYKYNVNLFSPKIRGAFSSHWMWGRLYSILSEVL